MQTFYKSIPQKDETLPKLYVGAGDWQEDIRTAEQFDARVSELIEQGYMVTKQGNEVRALYPRKNNIDKNSAKYHAEVAEYCKPIKGLI